jgi:hypothetical protein
VSAVAMGTVFHDPAVHKLGKRAVKIDVRTKRMARYLTAALPPLPDSVVTPAIASTMDLNDQLGDCTCAAMAHLVQAWTLANGSEVIPTEADVLAAYEGACGYNPADPSTDQGGVELDVLNYWRATGIGGHKIAAFVALEPQNRDHVRASCFLFGGCYLGVALPISAQSQDVWSVAIGGDQGDPTPGSWGGHAVPIIGYNPTGPVCITWGQPKQMTWEWFDAYCDEAYCVLSADWAQAGKPAPSGFDLAALQADLGAVQG